MKLVAHSSSAAARKGTKAGHLPRKALARPGVLAAAMFAAVAGVVYFAGAQNSSHASRAVQMAASTVTDVPSYNKPLDIRDTPELMQRYGVRQANLAAFGLKKSGSRVAYGLARATSNVVERDLTPNSASDERQPVYSPNGDYIAFVSNGKDSNKDGQIDGLNDDGTYHIWVMNRDGSQQRRVTGLYADKSRNQWRPSWSNDGNRIVYVDYKVPATDGTVAPQLMIVRPFDDVDLNAANGLQIPFPEQITYLGGNKRDPAWSADGTSIAFACDKNLTPQQYPTAPNGQYDIFTIPTDGDTSRLIRITGGDNDPRGNKTDDWAPTYSPVTNNAIYFSSNRDETGLLGKQGVATDPRRIWVVSSIGTSLRCVTNPTKRPKGSATDIDDYPTISKHYSYADNTQSGENFNVKIITIDEALGFHTNSRVDDSDTGADESDDNVWIMPVKSDELVPSIESSAAPYVVVGSYSQQAPSQTSTGYTASLQFFDPFGSPKGLVDTITNDLVGPEGIAISDDRKVYVANSRGGEGLLADANVGWLERYNLDSRQNDGFLGKTSARFDIPPKPPATGLNHPGGVCLNGTYVYVASGQNTTNKIAIYRFSTDPNTAGLPGGAVGIGTGGAFSSGTDGFSGGGEGLAIGPDFDQAGSTNDLYLACPNHVNVYDSLSGKFLGVIVPNGDHGLSVPTGLAFNAQKNKLFVASSGSNTVLEYDISSTLDPVTKHITATFNESIGSPATGLFAPEGVAVADLQDGGGEKLFVSSFNLDPAIDPTIDPVAHGDSILRYLLDGNGTPDPATEYQPTGLATWLQSSELHGAASFAFDPLALQGPPLPPPPTPTPGSGAPYEDGSAVVSSLLSSALSSPTRFAESGLAGIGKNAVEDKAADIEPAFARSLASGQLVSQLAFSSGRQAEPFPQSGIDPNPRIVNPYGGNELSSTGAHLGNYTNDIWTTSAHDVTPPALVPQGIGNNQFSPLIAPQDNVNLPFSAPRTYATGLRPGNFLKVAFVLKEEESGLSSDLKDKAVTVSFRDATRPAYLANPANPNINAPAITNAIEQIPPTKSGFENLPLKVYDDGPCISDGTGGCLADSATPQGGHEREASAVAGDGNWYCESDPNTAPVFTPSSPSSGGDFYIDVNVADRAGNTFIFDRVWGFSTAPFNPRASAGYDLYVSDYATGQTFPYWLIGDPRFYNMVPTESYLLNDPGGFPPPFPVAFQNNGLTSPDTFDNVDVWRVLCRGPVPMSVLESYAPTTAKQIDPYEKDSQGNPGPFLETKRSVAVSKVSVLWHSPYAGTAYAGPGTILDAQTQQNLTNFLDKGGRLFVTGRDVAFSLTSAGKVANTFLSNELQSTYAGEAIVQNVTAGPAKLSSIGGGFDDPQFAFIPVVGIPYDYWDAAWSQAFNMTYPRYDWDETRSVVTETFRAPTPSSGVDLLSGGNSQPNTTVLIAYTSGGTPVGKRIERVRSSGLKSRAVFFSFGFEAVNRQYTNTSLGPCVNTRRNMADGIRAWFKTGAISGSVLNDKTNLPVPNFLMKVFNDSGDLYYARTDAKGEFEVQGLTPGGYTVQPVYDPAVDPNNLYTGGEPEHRTVTGGQTSTDVPFRVILPEPGSITGVATQSNATPSDRSDDSPLPNTPVLIRSLKQSSIFTNNGHYADIVYTNSVGAFTFSGVPSGFKMLITFNPNRLDFQDYNSSTNTYTDKPGMEGMYTTYVNKGGPNLAYGRRQIPDTKRPTDIVIPPANSYVINDPIGTEADDATDNRIPILVPLGPSVTGKVYLRDTTVPVKGATVTLTSTTGGVNPTAQTTGVKGGYVFPDVKAGKYTLKATYTINGATATKSTTVTVKAGVDLTAPNVILFLPQISGTVRLGGQPIQGMTVVLQENDGSTAAITRTSLTGAKGGYLLTNIPPGPHTYRVFASGSGYSGFASVSVTASADSVQDIVVARRGVYGKVFLNGALVKGAVVELLDSSGNSLSPAVTTASDDQGNYGFDTVSSGTYKVKASLYGDSDIVGPVTATSAGTQAPDLKLYVSRINGRVLFQDNTTASGVLVEGFKNGVSIGTVRTDETGSYVFRQLPAGTYVLTASFASSSGQVSATLVRAAGPVTAPDIILKPIAHDGTTFAKIGSYTVTLPYEDSNNPTTNNSGVTPATALVKNVFSLPMFDTTTGAQNYMLQKFNTTTLQYVALNPTDSVKRGEGYLLRVLREVSPGSDPLHIVLPASNNALKPLQGTIKTFVIVLHRNVSITNSPNNGLNLIGCGLKPSVKNSSVKVDAVVNGAAVTYNSIQDAFTAGVLGSNLLYIDPDSGATVTNPNGTLDPYIGYYLRTNVDNVKVTLTGQ